MYKINKKLLESWKQSVGRHGLGNKYECNVDQELQTRVRRANGQPADDAYLLGE